MSGKGWIAVDLDGCLAQYDHWIGAAHVGEPVPAMLERVRAWLAEGKEVRIFTARVYCPEPPAHAGIAATDEWIRRRAEANVAERSIKNWCVRHLGRELKVTCVKDFGMVVLWDDRCVQVEKNTGRRIG